MSSIEDKRRDYNIYIYIYTYTCFQVTKHLTVINLPNIVPPTLINLYTRIHVHLDVEHAAGILKPWTYQCLVRSAQIGLNDPMIP